ncbi:MULTISPECIES: sulfur carrier protein ThiS [Bacillus]|jgi:sulfur carrier protein|uniref:sulfur carrier protein ThiS n=1 Tax=Bacillus TaxID=1386 RepID=UPI0022E61B33|nr:sulfur carrier protein ThiS [Bacillus smithii]
MIVTINGVKKEIPENIRTVERLLEHLQVQDKKLVVEMNGEILNKDQHGQFRLKSGDVLEIVHFVGGG